MESAVPIITPSAPPSFTAQRATRLCKRCQTTKPIDAYTPYHGGRRRRVCDDCYAIIEAETTHKHCARCEIEKPLTDFYKSAASKDGYNSLCQRCHNGWEPEPKPPTLLETTIKACEQCHVEKPLAEFAQRLKICKACASINYHAKVAAVYPPDSAKACIVCKEVKLIDEFPKGSATFGRGSKCKKCGAAYTKQYALDNPEKVKRNGQRSHREMKASPEKRAANNARMRALRFKDHRKYMFKGVMERHKLKGVTLGITADDIPDMPEFCEASHVERPLFYVDGRKTDNSPSLDKIDNEKGYVPGNLAIISSRANAIKSDASLEEIEAIAAYMRRYKGLPQLTEARAISVEGLLGFGC